MPQNQKNLLLNIGFKLLLTEAKKRLKLQEVFLMKIEFHQTSLHTKTIKKIYSIVLELDLIQQKVKQNTGEQESIKLTNLQKQKVM